MTVNHIFANLDFTEDFEIRKEVLGELENRIAAAPIDTRNAIQA